MKRALLIACLAVLSSSGTVNARVVEESFAFGRFGTVFLYRESPRPSRVVLFLSGDGGWNKGVVDMARQLSSLDVAVAGIDINHYLRKLADSN